MATDGNAPESTLRKENALSMDKYGKKLVEATDKLQEKTLNHGDHDHHEKKGPAGGYDATPVPKGEPGYTIKLTFHSASNLPFADLSLTSDPYIHAVIKTDLPKRHKQDPDLVYRTPTIHRNVNPEWNASWVIAHMPASGFHLKMRLYDEDPTDHDDRLGNVHVDVGRIDEKWTGFKERKFTVEKRMGSKRAYTLRGCISLFSNIKMEGDVTLSVENLGKSEGEGGRAYTIAPLMWKQHYSPLMGRITGVKDSGEKGSAKYNFQAIQMQLRGPVPGPLYHRYVEFRPFIAGMFTSHTIKGRLLNHALHHQHARIYNYDTSTKYGTFDEPCDEMTRKFLSFVHYDQGGRIFTYVMTLDGQFRFTETGKEFGIDMLSKHTMHSDVSSYIAFSGEFFIRRLKHPHKDNGLSPDPTTEAMPPATESPQEKHDQMDEQGQSHASSSTAQDQTPTKSSTRPSASQSGSLSPQGTEKAGGKSNSFKFLHRGSRSPSASKDSQSRPILENKASDPSKEPAHYELIIDNDSGTYRPNAKFLPELKKFLARNLKGLKVVTLDCQKDEEKMKKLKSEQAEKKKHDGKQITYMQNSSMSSFSSSDEEELERRAGNQEQGGVKGKLQKDWEKVKHIGKNDKGAGDHNEKAVQEESHDTKDKDHDTTEQQRQKTSGTTTVPNVSEKKQSVSTDTDHRSFDTAFTENPQNEHFVTPKPSLAAGGLKQFDEESETPKAKQANSGMQGTIHDAVTSSA